jgi:hypothetical protein
MSDSNNNLSSSHKPKLLFHLGYPKTASTWLQNNFFGFDTDKFICPWGARAGRAIDHFVLTSGFIFDPQVVRDELQETLIESMDSERVVVISEESLISGICSGKYWGPETIRRITQCFPDAKVMLCIREQEKIIYSAYGEYIRTGGTGTIHQFIETNSSRPGTGPICRSDALLYDSVISHLLEVFGEDSVLVLPYEFLRADPMGFTKRILNFVDTEGEILFDEAVAHNGLGAFTLAIARYANVIRFGQFKSWNLFLRVLDKIIPNRLNKFFESKNLSIIAEFVGDSFKVSNQKTSKLISFDLETYGYNV